MKVMKIVVPLDGSAAAEAALPEAVNRVKANAGSRLLLVRAVDPISVPPRAGSYVQARAISEAAEYLGKVAARLRSEGVDRVGRAVWVAVAPAGLAIAEAFRTVKPDLIVMSDRDGDNGPGSITEFVRRQVPTPVLVVTSPRAELEVGHSPRRSCLGPLTRRALDSLDGPTRRAHVDNQDLEGRDRTPHAGGVSGRSCRKQWLQGSVDFEGGIACGSKL